MIRPHDYVTVTRIEDGERVIVAQMTALEAPGIISDAIVQGDVSEACPLRSLEEVASDARRLALDVRKGEIALDAESFATISELIADVADHLQTS